MKNNNSKFSNSLLFELRDSTSNNPGLIITDECINCGACRIECPNDAVYHPADKLLFKRRKIISMLENHFLIDSHVCTLCMEYDELKCIEICPMDAISV